MKAADPRKTALRFILLMGVVSLFGDITYEGGRSVAGPFLASLGAGAALIGLIGGAGEFVGYALRIFSGRLADRRGMHWFFVILGYSLILAIPLLAFTGRWETAVVLILLERAGKAVRAPSRDAILSHAAKAVGRGFGFGIHEAMDQIGALAGPLLMSLALFVGWGYRGAFALLALPGLLTIAFVSAARAKVPVPETFERPESSSPGEKKLSSSFWLYTAFVFLSVAGFANFPLISYHFTAKAVVSVRAIPLLYALAMGVDGAVAILIGKFYDRAGFASLFAIPILTLLIPFFAFSPNIPGAVAGMVLWGAAMGIHETIMRAAIADLTPRDRRGTAYGIFNAAYGLAWALGGAAMGFLYARSPIFPAYFSAALQIVSLPFLIILRRREKRG